MNIPKIQGNFTQNKFFIYAAADSVYFDQYAKPLINSVITNTPDFGIHIHIYNPSLDQIEFCQMKEQVSYTFENIDLNVFDPITNYWMEKIEFDNERQRQMKKKGETYGRDFLKDLIIKTYYACVRFIRLNEINNQYPCLAIDVDGIVRKPFSIDQYTTNDFYLHEKKSGEHLAGALLLSNANSFKFLNEYAANLEDNINQNKLYWFLDQVILDQLVMNYNKGLLPMSLIDWAMKNESPIWSAKGKRKFLDIFQKELQKYV